MPNKAHVRHIVEEVLKSIDELGYEIVPKSQPEVKLLEYQGVKLLPDFVASKY